VFDSQGDGKSIIRIHNENEVIVRDPRCPENAPAATQLRRYNVSSAFNTSEETQGRSLKDNVAKPALEWLWDGFNACIMAYGQTGMGKTQALFGEDGVCDVTLQSLFNKINASKESAANYTVGISYWDLHDNNVVDVLPFETQKSSTKFCTVQVPGASYAHRLLREGRSRSINWSENQANSNEAHSFVRVVLHDAKNSRVSTLHIVDLVGCQSLSKDVRGHPAGTAAEALSRKVANQQLLVLSRVISELASAKTAKEEGKVMSSRASKLTQILSPLLGGNCKTYVIATVSDSTHNYLDTVNTMRLMQRACSIQTACMRTFEVEVEDLKLTPLESILSEKAMLHPTSPSKESDDGSKSSQRAIVEELIDFYPSDEEVDIFTEEQDNKHIGLGFPEVASPTDFKTRGNSVRSQELVSPSVSPPVATIAYSSRETGDARASPTAVAPFFRQNLAPKHAASGVRSLDGEESPLLGRTAQQLRHDINQSISHILAGTDRKDNGARPFQPSGATMVEMAGSHAGVVEIPHRSPTPASPASGLSMGHHVELDMSTAATMTSPSYLCEEEVKTSNNDLEPNTSNIETSSEGTYVSVRAQLQNEAQVGERAHSSPETTGDESVSRGEIALLKSNYQNLLDILKRQEKEREAKLEAIDDQELQHLETMTQYELEIETLKLENIDMRSKLRNALKEGGYEQAFAIYEGDIAKMRHQLDTMQESSSHGAAKKASTGLKQKNEALEDEIKRLEKENMELEKTKRASVVQRKCFEDAGRRTRAVQAEHERTKKELAARSEALEEAHMRLVQAEQEVVRLSVDSVTFSGDSSAEIHMMRRQIHTLQEQLRLSKLKPSKARSSHEIKRPPSKVSQTQGPISLCRKLERQIAGVLPKSTGLCNRLLQQLEILDKEQKEQNKREDELIELLQESQDRIIQLETQPLSSIHNAAMPRRPQKNVSIHVPVQPYRY